MPGQKLYITDVGQAVEPRQENRPVVAVVQAVVQLLANLAGEGGELSRIDPGPPPSAGWSESWRITQTEIHSFIAAQENPVGCRSA